MQDLVKTVEDKVDSLKRLTEWTGEIYKAQAETIKRLPFLVYDGVEKHTTTVDVEQKKVLFEIVVAEKQNNAQQRVDQLAATIRSILGNLWVTEVRQIVKSKRRKQTRSRKKRSKSQ